MTFEPKPLRKRLNRIRALVSFLVVAVAQLLSRPRPQIQRQKSILPRGRIGIRRRNFRRMEHVLPRRSLRRKTNRKFAKRNCAKFSDGNSLELDRNLVIRCSATLESERQS